MTEDIHSRPDVEPGVRARTPANSPLDARLVRIGGNLFRLPFGHRLVHGRLARGDLYLVPEAYRNGEVEWLPIPENFINRDPSHPYCGSDWYLLVIRPEHGSDARSTPVRRTTAGTWMSAGSNIRSVARDLAEEAMLAAGLDPGDHRTRDRIIKAISPTLNGSLDYVAARIGTPHT